MKEIKTSVDITAVQPGPQGPLFYPAGIWDASKTYVRTEDLCPFVMYDTGDPKSSYYYFPGKLGRSNQES